AARIAARLNTGLCSQCTALKYDELTGCLEMERLIFGGAAVQKVICQKRPQMATIAPRVFEPACRQNNQDGEIRELPAPPLAKTKVLDRKPKDRASGSLTGAKVIICAGRGVEKEEDLALIRNLAEAAGGEIGCTRPISEELHWLPEDTCIGLSGKQVKPDLYIGMGISGQVQHITGIRDARVIGVVNNDENAPIFDVANYGIVGDLYEVVPELTRQLKEITNK
ncbi:MAG TPA: electron transfer flavoprotein subunit alpha/FixB family protein, partial [Syntrophomonadaceae bacterium]|nr:electron transfer flavoprotein subunit alpha/FixB family protein [Syntrophomonadaceae bacterium]